MREKFVFSDGQSLSNVDSTGVISTNIMDLEEDVTVDQQVLGWLNICFRSAVVSGLTEGMYIDFRTSDATNGGTPTYLGVIQLLAAEVVAGAKFSIGVCKASLKKYLSVWYRAHTTANTGAIVVDAYFSEQPEGPELRIQKKPT